MKDQILIVDEEADIYRLIRQTLEPEGYVFTRVHQRQAALVCASMAKHSLILLDAGLRSVDGLELLRGLRERSAAPVMILTLRDSDADRIQGLESGADDYVSKRCNPQEVIARIHALLRRGRRATPESSAPTPEHMQLGDLELDPGARLVYCRGKLIETTPAEFDLLALLARSEGSTVSREELSVRLNGRHSDPLDRSIDMHVCNLRRKLGPGAGGLNRIRTVRGVGYFLAQAAAAIPG